MANTPKDKNQPNADANLIAEAFAAYSQIMAEMARVRQRAATMLHNYEQRGVDPKALKHAYRMSGKDDAALLHFTQTSYLAMLGIIETEDSGQTNFGKALEVPKPSGTAAANLARMRAHSDGYNTGRAGGLVESCRFSPGSEEYVAWRDGWQDGHDDRLAANPDAGRETAPGPRRRGRKKGDENAPGADERQQSASESTPTADTLL